MHTEDRNDPLVDLGYEQKDIDPKRIFKVSVIFFGFAFVCYFFGWAMLKWGGFGYFEDPTGVNDLMSTKIPAQPNPLLQTNVTAKTDIKVMRQKEDKELQTAGPSEHVPGANRITIEQAIKLSAERGAKLTSIPAVWDADRPAPSGQNGPSGGGIGIPDTSPTEANR